jgi:phosphatidylglycerophosphatase B
MTVYWATESAGRTGTVIILLIAGVLYAVSAGTWLGRIKAFFSIFILLGIVLWVFSYLNEHVLKPAIGRFRPSHTFIIDQTRSTAKLDSLYRLPEADRRKFFRELIASDTVSFKDIDTLILDHWVAEVGYSFPSGHSFNAFLLGTFLAFGLFHTRWRWLACVPLAWASLVALSRVALGVHSALDVSIGAAIGMIIAYTLLQLPIARRLLAPHIYSKA